MKAGIPEIKAKKSLKEILQWTLQVLRVWKPKLSYKFPEEAGGGAVELDLFGKAIQPKPENTSSEVSDIPHFVAEIKETLEAILKKANLGIWLMIDRLDEVFPRRSSLETRALRGLLRSTRLFTTDTIRIKIFLRDDMLEQAVSTEDGFTALTHLTARQADTLRWSEDQILRACLKTRPVRGPGLQELEILAVSCRPRALTRRFGGVFKQALTMLVKRLFADGNMQTHFKVDKEKLETRQDYRQECFYKVFPPTVHSGTRQSSTLRWMYNHTMDGRGVVTPRDILDLVTKAKQTQQDAFNASPNSESPWLIGPQAMLYGLEELSRRKKDTYLRAEFPHLWPDIEKFQGGKSEYSAEALQALFGKYWEKSCSDLISIGLLTKQKNTYWIPHLYRKGLELTQGHA
jgi:hypothetical protein